MCAKVENEDVLTLQQIVLSKNRQQTKNKTTTVLTLQQIVLSKNAKKAHNQRKASFDFTTNCSF